MTREETFSLHNAQRSAVRLLKMIDMPETKELCEQVMEATFDADLSKEFQESMRFFIDCKLQEVRSKDKLQVIKKELRDAWKLLKEAPENPDRKKLYGDTKYREWSQEEDYKERKKEASEAWGSVSTKLQDEKETDPMLAWGEDETVKEKSREPEKDSGEDQESDEESEVCPEDFIGSYGQLHYGGTHVEGFLIYCPDSIETCYGMVPVNATMITRVEDTVYERFEPMEPPEGYDGGRSQYNKLGQCYRVTAKTDTEGQWRVETGTLIEVPDKEGNGFYSIETNEETVRIPADDVTDLIKQEKKGLLEELEYRYPDQKDAADHVLEILAGKIKRPFNTVKTNDLAGVITHIKRNRENDRDLKLPIVSIVTDVKGELSGRMGELPNAPEWLENAMIVAEEILSEERDR